MGGDFFYCDANQTSNKPGGLCPPLAWIIRISNPRTPPVKIAGVQMDVALTNVDKNLSRMIDRLRETTAAGARLSVFPECALNGYCFSSLDEARPYAQTIPGPATERMRAACAELGCYAIF